MRMACPCGKEFSFPSCRDGRKKYCSKKCFYEYRIRPSGLSYRLKVTNKGWFKTGQRTLFTGANLSVEKRHQIRLKLLGRRCSPRTEFHSGSHPWNKGRAHPQIQNERHFNWKGDSVGYASIHSWVTRNLGRPSKCQKCGTTRSKRFSWHNLSGEYRRDLSDWQRQCSMCHAHEHKNWEKLHA
jgi:hypothetical protein